MDFDFKYVEGGYVIFDGLNLILKVGEKLVLLGFFGMGKSILFKLILGDLILDSGMV